MPQEDEEDISTYVSCPKCMSDSFIKAEVLGDGMCVLHCPPSSKQPIISCSTLAQNHSIITLALPPRPPP